MSHVDCSDPCCYICAPENDAPPRKKRKHRCGYRSGNSEPCPRTYETARGLAQHQARYNHKTKRATTSR